MPSPIIAIAIGRFIYRATKLLTGQAPEDVQAREEIKLGFQGEVVEAFKSGYYATKEEIAREQEARQVYWRNVRSTTFVMVIALITSLTALYAYCAWRDR